MKAVQISEYGARPSLVDVDSPRPRPDEVVVKVAGAALKSTRPQDGGGLHARLLPCRLPYTLGNDVSGTIAATGSAVLGWTVGELVVTRLDPTRGGGYAEEVVVPADQLVAAPTSLALAHAAGVVTTAATAWQALTEVADLQPGQKILIHAGAGGVGSFAIQFARALGAHVLTTASGPGLQIARELGAHQVIDYNATDFRTEASELDVVLDTVGGDVEGNSLEVLKADGLLVATPMPPDEQRAQARGLRAQFVLHASDSKRLADVVTKIDEGARLLVDRTFPLDAAPDALAYLAGGRAKGKVVLVLDGSS